MLKSGSFQTCITVCEKFLGGVGGLVFFNSFDEFEISSAFFDTNMQKINTIFGVV